MVLDPTRPTPSKSLPKKRLLYHEIYSSLKIDKDSYNVTGCNEIATSWNCPSNQLNLTLTFFRDVCACSRLFAVHCDVTFHQLLATNHGLLCLVGSTANTRHAKVPFLPEKLAGEFQ
jgi:hypothetical protein